MSANELRQQAESAMNDILVAKVDLVSALTNLTQALGKVQSIDGVNPKAFSLRESLVILNDAITHIHEMSPRLRVAADNLSDYQSDVG